MSVLHSLWFYNHVYTFVLLQLFCKTFLVLLILANVERYVSLAESITFPGQEPYRAYASSGASPGTLVYRLISLTSSDETVTYSIIKSDSSNPNLFAIDSSSGIITNAAPYPASQSQYNLVVQAGLTNGSLVNANLTVHIVPVYETTPKFEHDAYTVYISENGDVDELVTITQAFSLVITNTKMYALVGGNTGGAFSIETNGVIYTKTSLNREDNSQYSLTVRYVDDSGSADTQVQVNVLDINDNSPVFSKTLYQFAIDETKFSNEEVGMVVASDSDEGSNGDFSFSLTGTYASTFSISNDGVIITQSGLDYEQFSQYMLEVIAEDSGTMPLTASATILISVNNIDDECPIFSGSLYIKDLPYNPVSPPTLGVILTVVANDPDNIGPVQYSIVSGNEDGFFSMDSSSGNISLLHNDGSIRGQYRLTVSANDQTCTDGSFALVEISIGSANEHSPVFSDSSCVATLSENPDIDTLVTILEATDNDVGSNGQIQYEIVSNIGDYTLFNVHPLSGNVTTTSDSNEYDREAQAGFQIGVTATDGGFRQDFCILDITLLDRNDNPPVFEIDPYETSLNDNLDEGSYVIQVQAQDPDFAENGKVLYYLTSPVGCPFIIDENTGTITLNNSIITQAECSLNVTAVDQGMHSLNTTATVTINIQSGNDLPVFKQSIYTVTIAEDYPATDIIIHLNATGAIVYNVLEGSDYRTNNEGNFNIYDASGGIYITSDNPVDYERLYPGPYSFRLFVTAANTAGAFSLAVVNINVTDINDNHPIFSENSDSTITFNVVENQHPGPIGILKAVDKDTGSNGVILYKLHETSDSFTVSENGTVSSLVQNLDAEGIDTDFTIYVVAYNDGFEDQGDVAIVSIVIEDINDNEPSFAEDEYYIELNETHLVHSILLKLIAIDPDENDQNNLVFTIISGNNAATFQIESSAGIGSLILKRQLDYESITQYSLQIQVNDGLHTDITTVIIDVLDIDDEPPIFEQNEYNITVIENTPFGSQILTVQATDEDSDIILYEVRGLAEGRFYINSTGSITVIGDIDREEFLPSAQIVFLVFAFGGSLTTANIIVNISDINDYVPIFILSPFYGTAPENTAPGSVGLYVVTVKAVDLDEGKNGTITYSLVSGENKGFLIDPVTGIVTANRTFDREAKKFFHLEARATDNGTPIQLFSTVDVIVEISDYNDNPPYWPYPYMFARVYENSQIGKTVIQLPANDPDNGINGSIIFSLTGGNELGKFSLNTSTGEITVAGPLDYEDEDDRVHFLYFSIHDAGNPSLTSNQIGELEIHVLDGNDHVPQFPNNNVSLTIPEDLASGTLVHTLTATDTDQGSNSQLTYSILNGNVGDVFIIQSDITGVASIFSQSSLDYETVPFYALIIIVTDAGYPSLTATVLINITITDLNDEPPQFTMNTYVTNLSENQPSRPLVLINATDPDSDDIPGGLIDHYELHSSDNDDLTKFSLMDKYLYSTDNLDREQKEQYILTVTAIDDDPVNSMTGTATIIINILDVNDNPSDNGGHLDILIQSLNGLFPEQELGSVYFNDPDIDDIFSDCEIVSGDDHLFTVNNNCSLYTIQDNPPPGEYSLMIRGNDGMNPSVTSSVSITVENVTTLPPSSSLITLTLNSSTSNYFSTIHSSIRNTLSSVLSLSSSQINIISVQNDNEIDTVDINVAAVDSTGDYITQSTLIHKIYVSRNELSFDNTILYSLPTDLCVTEPCQNLGECQTISNLYGSGNKISSIQYILFSPLVELRYQCVCYPGTTGNHCEINYDDCYSNPCQYEAACTDGIQDFQCDCFEGTSGKDCSENPDECVSNPCQNDATCINGLNTAICECPSGYYGSRCEYTYFNPSSQCDSNPCRNNGTCSPGRDSFTCLCTDDFTGLTCEKEIQFQGGCVGNPCYNGSTCIETNDGYVCSCSVGFTGPQCRFPLNNCELELCRNGATCETGVYGSYRCVCPIGFTGEHCTDMLPPCDANPCLNDGICINNGTDSYYCECAREHYGQYCQYFINPPDLCEDDPCNSSSICSSGQSTYTCFCFNGAGGLDCSDQPQNLSPCDSNPCFYGGKCNVANELNFTCECPVGYVGAHCEEDINECSSDPCESTGMCIDGFGSYLCSCEDGHTGRHCEITCPDGYIGEQCDIDIDYCSSSPCHNNGVCVEQPTGYSCVCAPVFTGPHCDITNNCTVNTCFNGGTCVNSDTSGHFCECDEQFTGEHCELLVVSFSGSSTLTSYRAYNGISFRGRGEIKFEFATSSQDGLLLLNTQLQKGDSMDFIAVEIIRGQLRVSYSLGDSPTNVTILSNSLDVTDGQWHTVEITINGKVYMCVEYLML